MGPNVTSENIGTAGLPIFAMYCVSGLFANMEWHGTAQVIAERRQLKKSCQDGSFGTPRTANALLVVIRGFALDHELRKVKSENRDSWLGACSNFAGSAASCLRSPASFS